MNITVADMGLIRRELRHAFDTPALPRHRPARLRSSNLPYCGLRAYYQWLRGDTDLPFNLLSTLYMNVGTMVHETLQNHLPSAFKNIGVIADWVPCNKPKCPFYERFPQHKPHVLSRSGCSVCHQFPEHREIEVNHPDVPASSHVDGLFVIDGTNRVYIVDYKTTNGYTIKKLKEGQPPDNTYRWQLRSYVNNMYDDLDRHGYILQGALLVYFERNHPINFHISPVNVDTSDAGRKENRKRLKDMSKGYALQTKVEEAAHQDIMDRESCIAASDMHHETKVCPDRQFHDAHMVSHWNGACPLANVCFDKKRRKAELQRQIDAYTRRRSLKQQQQDGAE